MAALLLAGAAGAADDTNKQAAKDSAHQAGQDAKASAQHAGDAMQSGAKAAGDSMQRSGSDATAGGAQANTQTAEDQRDREKKDSFDIEGKVSKVSSKSVTLQRDDAGSATLHTNKATKVELDGNTAHLSQLKPGQDVKASFNLQGDKPMAIEIKADSNK
ncbi:MAG: DUF5666 domain-containing protein [Anaeromyxobacter sp.]